MKKNVPLGTPGETRKRVFSPSDRTPATRRAFSYQDHAGLVLLYESLKTGTYEELWFEHHDDILGVRADGSYDVYQVKTKEAADEKWRTVDKEMAESVAKFCALEEHCGNAIANYHIYSNLPPFVPSEHAPDQSKDGSSIPVLATRLQRLRPGDLDGDQADYFRRFAAQAQVAPDLLAAVLRKLSFKKGRSIEGFRDEIVTEIQHAHIELDKWNIAELRELNRRVRHMVESASTADLPAIDVYASHYAPSGQREAEVQRRRVTVESVRQLIENAIRAKKYKRRATYAGAAAIVLLVILALTPRASDTALTKAINTIKSAGANATPAEFPESVAIVRAARKPLIGLDLDGAQLACQDLSDLDLRRLQGRSLHGTGVLFDRSNLAGGDLSNGELNMAKFRRADLEMAHLHRANLLASNFYGVSARFANFTDATLNGANMSRGSFNGANFTNAVLSLAELDKSDLENADFAGAQLDETNLSEANLKGARNLTQGMLAKSCNDPKRVPLLDRPLLPSNRPCAASPREAEERKIKRLLMGFVGMNAVTQGICKNGESVFRPSDSKTKPQNNLPIVLDFSEIEDLPAHK